MTTKMESSLAVVIYGVDGIGKTTLANAVISLLDLKDYNYTGVEIHEDFHKNDLKCIQQQILKDLFPQYENGRNLQLRNCAEGRHHLTRAFRCLGNKPVFVFIDNACGPQDLQDILPTELRDLPHGSRILVTARNKGVTDMLEKASLERQDYQVNGLPNEQAKEILLKRAGDNVKVNKDEMDSILQICCGIPLLLDIVGSRLHKANTCTQTVEALRKGEDIRGENVTNRLFDFVYNQLEDSTQQAFLDICCFFTNWGRRHVEYILGPEEVTLLEDAALIKISTENEVIVHDVILAIGIRKSKGSRIRDLQSLEEAVKDEKVKVKGVWLREDEAEQKYQLEAARLSSMKKSLRVLSLGSGIRVSERIQKASKFQELRFMQINGDIPSLPVDLESPERLAVYHGPICVEGVNIYQLPKKLQALKAVGQSECTDLSTQWRPSQSMQIRDNSSLKELDLQELKNLQRLPDRLDHLTALLILLLDDCGFQVLPEQICCLSSLMELKLTSCEKLTELPSSFGKLTSLKQLNLAQCIELKNLPESFTQLSSLEILNLDRCWKLEALPSSFGKLKNLLKLSLQSNALKELPSTFGELKSLGELKCNCMLLQDLSYSFEQLPLFTLDLSCCMKLKRLPPSIEKLSLLKDFNLSACCMLKELPPKIVELQGLKTLNLWKCDSLKNLPFSVDGRRGKDFTLILPDHLRDKTE